MSAVDLQRFVTVYQWDGKRIVPASFNPHASDEQIARALCDSDIDDLPVFEIVEAIPSEGSSRFITEDIARLIPAIFDEAAREWRKGCIQPCAVDLMKRACFGVSHRRAA